ncbi:hypothetical protein PIB30_078391 [Stylosanthes scabra]|uniref:Uncharacterized protein n=1 Tax=Stylosanthes scabra TaxID=79078 RepID=A0ABU6YRF1_9FABA|nr:hypothetical protein [Stylosanthes scabra]
MNQVVVDNANLEHEDYVLDADEMASFDDHLDNLFAKKYAREQNMGKRRKDNDWWSVEVIEDGVIRPLKQIVFDAVTIPPGMKIVLNLTSRTKQ